MNISGETRHDCSHRPGDSSCRLDSLRRSTSTLSCTNYPVLGFSADVVILQDASDVPRRLPRKCNGFLRSKESPRLAVKPCRLHIPVAFSGLTATVPADSRFSCSCKRCIRCCSQSITVRKTNTTKHGESMEPACLTSCPWGTVWSANILRYTEAILTTCIV